MASEAMQVPSTADSMLSENGILERGDAPAQAILHANSQAMALRKAAETQEELGKINERVEKTLSSYQLADTIERPISGADIESIKEDYIRDQQATLELVDDLTQLVIILSDPIAKKKYQQQVTIFIVGYENLCGNRVKLLNQLQDFFIQNSKEEDAYDIEYPDFDIEEVGKTVRNALEKAEKAHDKLDQISKEVVKVLESVNPKEAKSRKKKLEKAIIQSRDDIIQLTEKLTNVQKELETSEGKLTQLYKTLEGKQMEIEKLKGHVEMGKRKAQELEDLKEEMDQKNGQLLKTRQEMDKLKLLLAHAEDKHEHVSNKQKESREAQQRMKSDLEERLKEQQQKVVEIRQAMETQHDSQIKDLRNSYQNEINEIKEKYEEEISKLKENLAIIEKQKDDAEKERIELQRFSSSFFNDDPERVRSASKVSWKASANAVRITSKKSQTGMSTLGTDSIPSTPRKALKTDGSIGSFKSLPSNDAIKPITDRQATEFTSFPGTSMTPTVKLPGTPAAPTPATPTVPGNETPNISSVTMTTTDAAKVVPTTPANQLEEIPEKTVSFKGKKNANKVVKRKSIPSRRQARQSLPTQDEVIPGIVEMVDEAVQTEVIIPEKTETDIEVARRISLSFIPEDAIKDFDDNNNDDDETKWDEYPIVEIPARFAHYRKQARTKQDELKNELGELKQKYNNKVQALKGMMDLRNNWNMERDELINQLASSKSMKEEAEKEAEMAMLQLEEVMAEQEEMRLELKLKSDALKEVQTMTSPLQTASRSKSQLVELNQDEQKLENESENDNGKEIDKRPITVPTIITSDGQSSEVLLLNKPDVMSTAVMPERIMSAKARTRLVNSALKSHPVAHEIILCYKNLLEFKDCIIKALSKEDLEEEAVLLGECEIYPFDENDYLAALENVSNIRKSSSEILECMKDIIPGLITTDDILFSNLNADDYKLDAENVEKDQNANTTVDNTNDQSTTSVSEVIHERQEDVVNNDRKMSDATAMKTLDETLNINVYDSNTSDVKSNSEHVTDQKAVQTMSDSKSDMLQVSSNENGKKESSKRLSSREGRKRLVQDYKELIAKHQKLSEEFENINRQMKASNASYEQQLIQNADVMQNMNTTINDLKSQLDNFQITHPLTVKASQIQSPDFMFTSLDVQHNARALKRGLQNGRISYDSYKEICNKMEDYVSIPIQRFARLARKYLHHTRMKQVENAIRVSNSLDDKVYDLLDKMEDFQQARTLRWEDRMAKLANEREQIAKLLVKTLEMIEHETGIFLIKPIMSIPSRRRLGSGYIVSRRIKSADGDNLNQSSGSLVQPSSIPSSLSQHQKQTIKNSPSIQNTKRLKSGSLKMDITSIVTDSNHRKEVWNVDSSFGSRFPGLPFQADIPKIMELDLNRSMFPNNLVSAKLSSDVHSNGGPLHSNVLSYVTVTRPTGEIPKRSFTRLGSTGHMDDVPPSSPYDDNSSTYQVRQISSHNAPLPPIRSSLSDGNEDGRSVSTYISDAERHISPILSQSAH